MIGGYVRLSRDEDAANYSSIISQKKIIQEYAEGKKLGNIYKYYEDDNYSGYTFERPAFKEMMLDLENGKIDMIIAKDFSRLGRHNAKMLLLIENIRELGKRLIVVEEGSGGYDTFEDDDDIIGIKTWYNERYIKDISRKIRSSFRVKQKDGTLIFHEYYGYRKHPLDKHQLVIDEECAEVVKIIFDLYIQGYGYYKIIDYLNKQNISTPSMIVKKHFEEQGKVLKSTVSKEWQTYNISRIIKDDIYAGTLRLGKTKKLTIKGKPYKTSLDEQYIFLNHHEPIIDKQTFELALEINQQRNNTPYRGNKKHEYIFSKFVYCGHCGSYMTGRNVKGYPIHYLCGAYQKYGKKKCIHSVLRESMLLAAFKEYLKAVKKIMKTYIESITFNTNKKNSQSLLTKLEKEFAITNEELKMLLSQKIKDLLKEPDKDYRKILEKNYDELESAKKKRIVEISNQLDAIKKLATVSSESTIKSAIIFFDEIINKDIPSKEDLHFVLEKIVHKDNVPVFHLKNGIDIPPESSDGIDTLTILVNH